MPWFHELLSNFGGDSSPAGSSSTLHDSIVQAGASWRCLYMHWFARLSLATSWKPVSQGCDFHVFLNQESNCLSQTQQRKPMSQPCTASTYVSLPHPCGDLLSCTEAREDCLVCGRAGLLQDTVLCLLIISLQRPDCDASVSFNWGTCFQRPC